VAAVLLAVALVCGGVLAWTEVGVGETSGPPVPATPVLSLRRVPTLLARLAAGAQLQDDLDRAVGTGRPGAAGACLAVHDAEGRVLYSWGADRTLKPASTVKLLTAAAVLRRIGATTRLVTEVRAARAPRNGVVDGDLWLVGGGDPLLATAEFVARPGSPGRPRPASRLEELADRIVRAGVREVRGRLIGDESRYDSARDVPTWKPEYVAQGQSGPLSALTVNRGFVRVRPTPVRATAPATHAAATLAALLAARGVRVAGAGEGAAPRGAAAVAMLESLPVGELVAEMVTDSDNTAAELLTKELGFRFAGAGSTAAGLSVIRSTVAGLAPGVTEGLALLDGSGLDRADRATCAALTALLDAAAVKQMLRGALPVAARSGTLAERFVGTAAAGRIRAKTGSLDDVAALSGYARDAHGDELSFTMLVNDMPTDIGRELVDRVGLVLVDYPRTPPLEQLGPRQGAR
jgi:D-alanyl-D-alanine carboxypeptidase/D-alanyl-D-alanine-endopeptidase (penicillin-binding protein 4)